MKLQDAGKIFQFSVCFKNNPVLIVKKSRRIKKICDLNVFLTIWTQVSSVTPLVRQ